MNLKTAFALFVTTMTIASEFDGATAASSASVLDEVDPPQTRNTKVEYGKKDGSTSSGVKEEEEFLSPFVMMTTAAAVAADGSNIPLSTKQAITPSDIVNHHAVVDAINDDDGISSSFTSTDGDAVSTQRKLSKSSKKVKPPFDFTDGGIAGPEALCTLSLFADSVFMYANQCYDGIMVTISPCDDKDDTCYISEQLPSLPQEEEENQEEEQCFVGGPFPAKQNIRYNPSTGDCEFLYVDLPDDLCKLYTGNDGTGSLGLKARINVENNPGVMFIQFTKDKGFTFYNAGDERVAVRSTTQNDRDLRQEGKTKTVLSMMPHPFASHHRRMSEKGCNNYALDLPNLDSIAEVVNILVNHLKNIMDYAKELYKNYGSGRNENAVKAATNNWTKARELRIGVDSAVYNKLKNTYEYLKHEEHRLISLKNAYYEYAGQCHQQAADFYYNAIRECQALGKTVKAVNVNMVSIFSNLAGRSGKDGKYTIKRNIKSGYTRTQSLEEDLHSEISTMAKVSATKLVVSVEGEIKASVVSLIKSSSTISNTVEETIMTDIELSLNEPTYVYQIQFDAMIADGTTITGWGTGYIISPIPISV